MTRTRRYIHKRDSCSDGRWALMAPSYDSNTSIISMSYCLNRFNMDKTQGTSPFRHILVSMALSRMSFRKQQELTRLLQYTRGIRRRTRAYERCHVCREPVITVRQQAIECAHQRLRDNVGDSHESVPESSSKSLTYTIYLKTHNHLRTTTGFCAIRTA